MQAKVVATPSDFLLFSPGSEAPAEIALRNVCQGTVAFRIKTNAPAAYNVSPSVGSIDPGAESIVKVTPKSPVEDSKLRHKFQILVSTAGEGEALACLLGVKVLRNRDSLMSPGKFQTAAAPLEDPTIELERTRKKVKNVDDENWKLLEDIANLRMKIVSIVHRRKFEESGQKITQTEGYTCYHLVVSFFCGVMLTSWLR